MPILLSIALHSISLMLLGFFSAAMPKAAPTIRMRQNIARYIQPDWRWIPCRSMTKKVKNSRGRYMITSAMSRDSDGEGIAGAGCCQGAWMLVVACFILFVFMRKSSTKQIIIFLRKLFLPPPSPSTRQARIYTTRTVSKISHLAPPLPPSTQPFLHPYQSSLAPVSQPA